MFSDREALYLGNGRNRSGLPALMFLHPLAEQDLTLFFRLSQDLLLLELAVVPEDVVVGRFLDNLAGSGSITPAVFLPLPFPDNVTGSRDFAHPGHCRPSCWCPTLVS